ncbi:MAG: hypothetical protein M0P02_00760 [Sulfurospirillaceae bacterium]|jgi:hypothetical protein|nr:hypothetical protein [Sulfurospirillaceae bacterium]MCK9545596.1 hypothetical protein [Sulfurospirillaceae bacterium]MDY0238056.1 hypothetical protein [Campylobacterales bacterium]
MSKSNAIKEKSMRVKYIRALEKFVKSAISILKREDFDFLLFQTRVIKNYSSQLEKVQSVVLDSTYSKNLELFANEVMLSVQKEPSLSIKEELLNSANALEKLKSKSNYKRDNRVKNSIFNEY